MSRRRTSAPRRCFRRWNAAKGAALQHGSGLTPMRIDDSRWRVRAALWAICLAALALRLLGLGYGLPAIYNPDETPILSRALALAKGDPNPHNFLYPSLYFYAVFAWEVLFFAFGRVVGLFQSIEAFQREFFTDPSRLFLAGRLLTALCGTATVVGAYAFARRLYGATAGLAAAAFYAVAPIAVRDAHYIKLDVPVTLVVVLAHAVLARIVVDAGFAARRRSWVVAGLLAGLSVSTHYYAIFVVFAVAAAAIADVPRSGRWTESAGLLTIAALATIAGFLAGTPFIAVEPQTAIRDIAGVREVDIDRAVVGGVFPTVVPYLRILLVDAVGWPVAILSAIGMIGAVVADWRRGLLLVAFTVPFLAFVMNTVPMSRYLNVILPIMAVAGAWTIHQLAARVGRVRPAAAVLAGLAAVPGLAASVRTDLFFRETDTRTLARDYLESHVPPGASILVQPYSAPLRPSREALIEGLRANLGSESRASIKSQLMLGLNPYPAPAYRLVYVGDGGEDAEKIYISPSAFTRESGLEPLRRLGVQYVVLKRGNVENPAFLGLEAALARDGRLLAAFEPYRDQLDRAEQGKVAPYLHNTSTPIASALARPGPSMQIWSVAIQ